MAKLLIEVECGRVLCSGTLQRFESSGCPLGHAGGWCSAFREQREYGSKDYKRRPACLAAERAAKEGKK